jgi:chorismate lyase/3-hydroxybenzoate synthase
VKPSHPPPLRVEVISQIPAEPAEEHLLTGFRFGTQLPDSKNPLLIDIGLRPLGNSPLLEAWWCKGEVQHRCCGQASIAEGSEYGVVVVQIKEANHPDFELLTLEAYTELLTAIRSTTFAHIVKIWNYFDQINEGQGDRERYRLFSSGRAEAFDKVGIEDHALPTGTAIGTLGGGVLSLIALVSKHPLHGFENPRQVSAYRYPRKYGPRSPKFSRAGFVSGGEHVLFMLSGTAAVVGHDSAHPYDVESQTHETFNNLDLLVRAVTRLGPQGGHPGLDENSILRVYLRDPADYSLVVQHFKKTLGRDTRNVSFLQGDICRRELMIEIDGVKILA